MASLKPPKWVRKKLNIGDDPWKDPKINPIEGTKQTVDVLQGKKSVNDFLSETSWGDVSDKWGVSKDPSELKNRIAEAEKFASGVKQPEIPGLESARVDGKLSSAHTVQGAGQATADMLGSGLYADTRSLDAMRDRALSKEDSPWLKMAMQKQGLEELSSLDQTGATANRSAAMGRSALGMKGGLSGGAAERLAQNAGREMNMLQAGIKRQGQSDRLTLGMHDDSEKMKLLSMVPGFDLGFANQKTDIAKFNSSAKLDAQKFNIGQANDLSKFNTGNGLESLYKDNDGRMGIYSEQMKGWAAGQQGLATAKAGKK